MTIGIASLTLPLCAQVPVISPAAQQAHASISAYQGPATCISCHQQQALQMFGSVHYQEMGETPNVLNLAGPAGKGRNGARVMNSYCGTPTTSSRATCATCHSGNGQVPTTQLTTQQLDNIDCLLCHQDAYKRIPAPPYQIISFPGPNGLHSIQAPVEDENGFHFMPDSLKMTISILDAARTVHRPTRASCLRCHAGAGGSDGGKRGDISTVTANPPLTSDIHMSPQGANLSCANCHSAGNHRVAGRGVDLRPNDALDRLTCASCHTARPHGDYSTIEGSSRDAHAERIACQTCHIPTYAKDKSTEMERSWLQAQFSMAACRGQGGWVPSETRAQNVVPVYQWFDGTSLANVLGQVPPMNSAGEYILALPNGSVQSPGAKLYPMKVHNSDSAIQDSTGLMIPHSTFSFFTSGDFTKAVQDGQALSGMEGPSRVVRVQEFQTINHGVEAAENALRCGACHSSLSEGEALRMDLKNSLGYSLKGAQTQVCSQCHGNKSNPGFASLHEKHVHDKQYDCSACHQFSRPERGLNRVMSFLPAAPGGPVAINAADTRIDLVWADNSSSEQGFKIERSEDGTTFVQIGIVAANVTTTTDTGVSLGKNYYYRVRAYNGLGDSDYSLMGRASLPAGTMPLPPQAPAGLISSAADRQVTLNWNASMDATTYQVKRSTTSGGPYSVVDSGLSSTTYLDTSVVNGTTYYYVVSAVNAGGESPDSIQVSATPKAPVTAPLPPSDLKATSPDRGAVQLYWKQSTSPNISQNRIYRSSINGGPYTLVATITAGQSYREAGLTRGKTYYYVVTSVIREGLQSIYSNPASVKVR